MRTIHNGLGPVGYRVGAGGRPGEPERALADSAPRITVSFVCQQKHETICNFAATAKMPDTWPCPKCGTPAYFGDPGQIPQPVLGLRHAEHLQRVKDRRCEAAREAILQEALDRLHERRLRDRPQAPATCSSGSTRSPPRGAPRHWPPSATSSTTPDAPTPAPISSCATRSSPIPALHYLLPYVQSPRDPAHSLYNGVAPASASAVLKFSSASIGSWFMHAVQPAPLIA